MNVKRAVANQNTIFNILKQAKLNNRLSHAYLFYGEDGVGKKEMAYALACLFYCEHGGCLECETCKSIINNNHMNVDYIGIEDNKKMISKDQIAVLQEEFSKTSLVDGTRIYIVDGIDTASIAAQNSLLKFIEEPINQTPTIGIFLANDTSNVVSTIISRCILQHFKAIPVNKLINDLIEEGNDKLDSILVANLTNNVEEALETIKSDEFIKLKELFLELLDIKKPKEGVKYFVDNSSYLNNSKRMGIILQWIMLFLEDCILHGNTNENLILEPLYAKIMVYKKKNEECLRDKLKTALDLFNKLKYNISAKNVLHELIVKFI